MADHEIQLLSIGIAIGMDLMLLMQIAFGILDDRRDREASRRARRRAAAEHYYRSLRRYHRQVRFAEMYPSGVIEVAARRIELDLRDGLDRVERAARDEGLL